jgi:hypothetical protein
VFLDVDLFATRKAALELLSQTSRGRKPPNQLQAQRIGIDRRAKNITPSLSEYLTPQEAAD